MSILSVIPCCLVVGGLAFAIPVQDAKDERLAETVEDVETLRVLLTKELSGSRYVRAADGNFRLLSDLPTLGSRFYSRDGGKKQGDDDEPAADGESSHEEGSGKSWAAIETAEGQDVVAGSNVEYSYFPSLVGGNSVTSYTRAFYAPGIGAWIDTSARVPMVLSREKRNEEGDGDTAGDDWEQAKRSVRRPSPRS
jgi:hypothetical protein